MIFNERSPLVVGILTELEIISHQVNYIPKLGETLTFEFFSVVCQNSEEMIHYTRKTILLTHNIVIMSLYSKY